MKQSVALVLSSGGSRGLAHIGAVNKLEEYGFKISSVSGSSIGSVIGGVYAMGKLREYSEWLKTLDRKAVWGLIDFTLTSSGLLKGERVFDKMKTFIPDMNIEDMNIPFAAVATDILNEKEVVFTKGSFYKAARASIAIPAILTSVKYKGSILVDGGVLNPIPIEYVARNNDDILVVVNLYGDRKAEAKKIKHDHDYHNAILNKFSKLIVTGDRHSLGYISLLKSSSSAMVKRIAQLNIELFKPDILINIPHDSAATFDFHKADKLINIGAEAANKVIEQYLKNKGK